MSDVGAQLRASGRRMTPQRARVLRAVTALVHGRPDDIVATVAADGGPALPPSTVYRTLEALTELGVVDHTHLDHRAPSYHLAEHADHVHLVCRGCGRVDQCEAELADTFVAEVLARQGFSAQITHMAVHGLCAACQSQEDSR